MGKATTMQEHVAHEGKNPYNGIKNVGIEPTIQLGGLLRTYVLNSACLLLPECLRETKEKHDLKGHRAQTQTAALRVGGS